MSRTITPLPPHAIFFNDELQLQLVFVAQLRVLSPIILEEFDGTAGGVIPADFR